MDISTAPLTIDMVRARIDCMRIAAGYDSDPDSVVTNAKKLWLFATGLEQESEDDEPARG